MWPFRSRSIHVGTSAIGRRTESASTDRDDWLRDKEGAGPQGASAREMPDGIRHRAVRKSRVEFDKAAIYGGVLDRLIDFVLGDGILIKADDPGVDEWLQKQLGRGWYGRERKHVEALFIDGERMLVVRAPARTEAAPVGDVRIGSIDPLLIGRVHVNRFDVEDVVRVEVRPELGEGDALTLDVARGDEPPEPKLATAENAAAKERPHYVTGAFWRVNTRGVRGVPVLSRILDHAADLDNLVGNLVAQLEHARRLWLHVKHGISDDSEKGKQSKVLAFEAKVKAWATSWEPGEVLVTGGGTGPNGVTVEAHAPKLEMADAKALYDVVLEMCLGGHGIPKMWFGGGGDTNRAVGVEQGTPVHRAILSRQAEVKACVEQLVRCVLAMGEAAGVRGVTGASKFEVTMATVATRDTSRDVTEISGLVSALAAAKDEGAITPDELKKILRGVIKSKPYGEVLEDTAERDGLAAGTVEDGGAPASGPAGGPAPTEPDGGAAPPVEKVADAALNGAQVASLVEVLGQVTRGEMAPDAAVEVLVTAFPVIAQAKARRMVQAAAVFKPRAPADATPPAGGQVLPGQAA